ncbi:MAG: hypothetical protein ACTSQA_00390 [Candidatus Heimdallarchaeaceae archaeon]
MVSNSIIDAKYDSDNEILTVFFCGGGVNTFGVSKKTYLEAIQKLIRSTIVGIKISKGKLNGY